MSIMKKFTELTNDELARLTDDEIAYYCDIEYEQAVRYVRLIVESARAGRGTVRDTTPLPDYTGPETEVVPWPGDEVAQ